MKLALVLLALSAAFCDPPPPAPPLGPEDGGGERDCPAACATMTRLGCLELWGIDPADGDCTEFCVEVERRGDVTLCPAHIARASSCEEAERASQCEAP